MTKKTKIIISVVLIFIIGVILRHSASNQSRFQKTTFLSPWSYQANLDLPHSTVSVKTTQTDGIVNFQYQNSSVEFDLPLSHSSITQNDAHQVTFTVPEKNIAAGYQLLDNGLKEKLILYKIPSSSQFVSTLKTTNADIYLNSDHLPVFLDPKTRAYLFHVVRPFAYDAAGKITYDVSYQLYQDHHPLDSQSPVGKNELLHPLIKLNSKSSYQLVVKVNPSWLSSPSRVYPVTIDPTVVHNSSAVFATGTLNRIADVNPGSTPNLGTGGTITYSGGYVIHTFTGNGTFTPYTSMNVDVLVVGGGGGGGTGINGNGGGGAGGVVYSPGLSVSGSTSVTVGGGGSGGATNGGNSIFSSVTAIGGGAGGNASSVGSTGGSGGGGGCRTNNGGAGTAGQGNLGGNGLYAGGGGGGGAGGVGTNAYGGSENWGGNGGIGVGNSITGSNVYYAGGGAGGGSATGGCGSAQSGGTACAANGAANTGAGGGGNTAAGSPGAGASGVVIVRYPLTYTAGAPALTSYYQELPSDINTVGLWHLNESAGTTIADTSGNSNTGTLGTGTSAPSLGIPAILGTGISFNGTTDYISVGAANSINFNQTQAFTVEAWVKPAVNNTEMDIVNKQENTTNEFIYTLKMTAAGVPYFGVGKQNVLEIGISGPAQMQTSTWYHLTGVSNGNSIYLYVNGQLVTSAAISFSSATQSLATLYLGRVYSSGYYWNGTLDEIRISSVARTPEEIRLDASRRPYAVYTSPVVDLGTSTPGSWNSLSWTASGVTTGNGEVLSSGSSLVAQWNFNETSGTVASVAAGSCGIGCTGILTNFSNTSGQDVGTSSDGWTANNRLWGAGALRFNGNNSVVLGTGSSLNITSALTLESWVKTSSATYQDFISRDDASSNRQYQFRVNNNGTVSLILWLSSTGITTNTTTKTVNDGNWHYLVATYDSTTGIINIYIDGAIAFTSTKAVQSIVSVTTNGYIGSLNGGAYPFIGVIDSTRIYNRALTASEILSNYNAGSLELQTRVGNSSDPNDGTWENWQPTGNESSLDSFNTSTTQITDHLISYWPMEQAAGTTQVDFTGNNSLSSNNNPAQTTGIIGYGVGFTSASSQYFSCTQANCGGTSGSKLDFTATQSFSTSAWFKTSTSGNQGAIFAKKTNTANINAGYEFYMSTTNKPTCHIADGTNGVSLYSTNTYTDGNWHNFICVVDRSSQILTMYMDGSAVGSTGISTVGSLATANNFGIGAQTNTANYFNGSIDEVGIWGKALTSQEITNLYNSGSPKGLLDGTDLTSLPQDSGLNTSADTAIKMEGSGSQKISSGVPQSDRDTVGLWHLDETDVGTGATLYDSSGNGYNATATGTTAVDGISGKARLFNGSSNYLSTLSPGVTGSGTRTVEAWVKTSTLADQDITFWGANAAGQRYETKISATGGVFRVNCYTGNIVGTTNIVDGKWHHVAAVLTGTDCINQTLYVDGKAEPISSSVSYAVSTGTTHKIQIGYDPVTPGSYFNGSIDEVRVSAVARSAQEISEDFRSGRDHYLNRTLSTTDLSGKTSLPFYVASDRQGTFLNATIGESPFANYQPDANTVALWHLDEDDVGSSSAPTAFFKDASDNGNNTTPGAGTSYPTITQGKIGKARLFNGTTAIISCTNSSCGGTSKLDMTNANTLWTWEAWAKTTATAPGDSQDIISKRSGTGTSQGYSLSFGSAGSANCKIADGTNSVQASGGSNHTINDGNWHYLVCTNDGTNVNIYIDGVLLTSTAKGAVGTVTSSANFSIGANSDLSTSHAFPGSIDEVRIDNIVRSADDIRQAYEVGTRTHSITIDFKAALSTSNLLVGSTDYSFTINSQVYGAGTSGANLFVGDKIIIEEDVGGTNYIAQGLVNSVNSSTGAVTVSSWDATSTFPATGFAAKAIVFKWQREYFNPSGSLATQRNATTNLTLRLSDGSQGANIWLDDLRSSSGYLNNSAGSTINSTIGYRYFQYRAIPFSSDPFVSASLVSVSLDYSNTPSASATNCRLQKANNNSSINFLWTDNPTNETGYEVQRSVDGSAWSVLQTGLGVGTSSYLDSTTSSGHTYIYRVAPYNNSSYANWCSTVQLSLQTGSLNLNGLNLSGINID